jgi:hypothetical protein
MDFLKTFLGDNTSELVAGLVDKANFSAEQAAAFVPEAASSVLDAAKDVGNLDFSNLAATAQALIGQVDVADLGRKAGIGAEQAQVGLTTMVPKLLQLFQDQTGGAEGMMKMLGGLGEGGIAGILGSLGGLGKMFGK